MCFWQKLINRRISSLKIWFIWRYYIIFCECKKWVHFIVYKMFKYFSENWNKLNRSIFFHILSSLLWIGTTFAIFHYSYSIQEEKIEYNGLQHCFVAHMRTTADLFISMRFIRKFVRTLKISSVKFMVFKVSFVLRNIWVCKFLPVSIWVHGFAKNELNDLLCSLKSTNYYELKEVYR